MSDIPELYRFVSESNRIEGIHRGPTRAELDAHKWFLEQPVTVATLCDFVRTVAPGKPLRDKPGLNVFVGNHTPPPGGPEIRERLESLLSDLDGMTPWEAHVAYENLHPFMDGNGRSGRVLWLWMMTSRSEQEASMAWRIGFLHSFYYQTLEASDDHRADDWRDIESAPRDGTHVLLAWPYWEDYPVSGWFMPDAGYWTMGHQRSSEERPETLPTHWKPLGLLPTPPEGE